MVVCLLVNDSDHNWTAYSFEPLAHSQRGNDFRALRFGAKIGLCGVRRPPRCLVVCVAHCGVVMGFI